MGRAVSGGAVRKLGAKHLPEAKLYAAPCVQCKTAANLYLTNYCGTYIIFKHLKSAAKNALVAQLDRASAF